MEHEQIGARTRLQGVIRRRRPFVLLTASFSVAFWASVYGDAGPETVPAVHNLRDEPLHYPLLRLELTMPLRSTPDLPRHTTPWKGIPDDLRKFISRNSPRIGQKKSCLPKHRHPPVTPGSDAWNWCSIEEPVSVKNVPYIN